MSTQNQQTGRTVNSLPSGIVGAAPTSSILFKDYFFNVS
jgi:hypothetical protein